MERASILFGGSNETKQHVLECFATSKSIVFTIDMHFGIEGIDDFAYINLDRATAIRLSKELKRQIALLEV
jgi:hypothetical protein